MFWQTTEEIETLANFRKARRHREELLQDQQDFSTIFWDPISPEQKVWAEHMLKSINHELDSL